MTNRTRRNVPPRARRRALCVLALLATFAAASAQAATTSFAVSTCGPAAPPPRPCPLIIYAHPLGMPVEFWVSALDSNRQRDYSYTGTASFTSSDPTAALPPAHTFVASDQGAVRVSITFNSLGTDGDPFSRWYRQSLSAADAAGASGTGDVFVEDDRRAALDPIPVAGPMSSALLIALLAGIGLRRGPRTAR